MNDYIYVILGQFRDCPPLPGILDYGTTTGQGAEAVYRDKITGARILKDDYYISKQKKLELKLELEWGKGLAQKQEAQARLEELELEKDKPFARTRGDPELDKMLRQRLRWGDPMAHLVKNKHYEPILPDLGDNEKMKESGFVIPQVIKKRIRCFTKSIWYFTPGRHWDGVDRSTTGWFTSLFHS
ncbi:hypothetical protein Q3G72_034875 [Acer saccharum]|nr:hypothetical protein Q3G72_034875 [Acer saccharum]